MSGILLQQVGKNAKEKTEKGHRAKRWTFKKGRKKRLAGKPGVLLSAVLVADLFQTPL